jgi:integrase
MATMKFYLQSKNKPAGIYARFREGVYIDAKAKTKYSINPADWSEAKGAPKHIKTEGFKKLNKDLLKFKNEVFDHYHSCLGKVTIDSQWLKEFITPPILPNAIPTKLVPYFDYYALHKKGVIGLATSKKLTVNKRLLERFQKETKKEYLIKDVDANFKLRLEEFCQKGNYAPNTIAKLINFIKTICYHARYNGIDTHFQLDNISAKFEKCEKVYLTSDELMVIEKSDKIEAEYLLNARDWLLISCETGQRVSDFMRFTKEMIRYDKGKPLIEFTQVKTDKIMTVPLSKKVVGILEKRHGDFPRQISDQKYNDYIKDVCKLAGLTYKVEGSLKDPKTKRKKAGTFQKWELVSSHIGRRSFATNNYGRVPTSLLIGATGHSTEKMFLEYIGKSDSDKAIQLAEYF